MGVQESPFYCETIEEATGHGLYDECREEMIYRHHKRMAGDWRRKCVGLFVENTTKEETDVYSDDD